MTKKNERFLVLTEQEHDTIGRFWRAGEGTCLALVERYAMIHHVLLHDLAQRLACHTDAVSPALLDQIAHAVIARAIEAHSLQGSITGELVQATYYQGGGSLYLEQCGRLCFCPAYRTDHPRPEALHASACEDLWKAYAHAVNALLARGIRVPPLSVAQLCILDTTPLQGATGEPLHASRSLQQVVGDYLRLDEEDVRQVWERVNWLPGSSGDSVSSSEIALALEKMRAHLRIKGTSLFVKTAVLVVDDTAPATAMTSLALRLRMMMGAPPVICGVRWGHEEGWQMIEPIPTVCEAPPPGWRACVGLDQVKSHMLASVGDTSVLELLDIQAVAARAAAHFNAYDDDDVPEEFVFLAREVIQQYTGERS